MALNSFDKIDIVVRSPHIDGYDLILYDDGTIKDEIQRHNFMLDKLMSYANYVLSGEFYESYPDGEEKELRFCVVCKTQPNAAMLNVEAITSRENPEVSFSVKVLMENDYVPNSGATKTDKKWWEFWK